MNFFTLLFAIAKAVPIINAWLGQLVAAYTAYQTEQAKKQNRQAVKDAIETQDQTPLESEQYSGKPSGHGTVVDSLPRMRNQIED